MDNIQNISEGACASIVFYHFVKNSGSLEFSDIEKFAEKTISKQNIYYITIIKTLQLVKPIIEKYFDLIRKGLNWNELPNGKCENKLLKPIVELSYYGKSEYGNIAIFNRCILFLITGIWIEFDIDKLNNGELLLINSKMFDRYNNFLIKFVKNNKIPYLSSVLFINQTSTIKSFEKDMHIAFVLKNNNMYEIYDSNIENINYVRKYPVIIETNDDLYYKVLIQY